MSVQQNYLGTDSFNIRLRRGTPRRLLEALAPQSIVAILPVWAPLHALDNAAILSLACWSGVYYAHAGRRTELSGLGTASLLGMSGGLSDVWETSPYFDTAAKTIADHIADGVLRNGAGGMNGVTAGAITALATTRDLRVDFGSSSLDYLVDMLRRFPSYVWAINPDLTLDVDTEANLFRDGDVIIGDDLAGGSTMTPRGYRAELDPQVDWQGFTDRVIVTDDADLTADADIVSPFYGADGELLNRERVGKKAATSTTKGEIATSILNLWSSTEGRRSIAVNLPDAYCAASDMRPGDLLHIVDFWQDIGTPSGSPTYWRGEVTTPYVSRLRGMTWPVVDGMGIAIRSSLSPSDEWVDLTEWVEFESGPTSLVIGAPRRSVNVL